MNNIIIILYTGIIWYLPITTLGRLPALLYYAVNGRRLFLTLYYTVNVIIFYYCCYDYK